MQSKPKVPPTEPKKVDANKKKSTDVASTSGTKITTSNQFDALNMDDIDELGIPTYDINKDVESGSKVEAKKDVESCS